MAAVISSESSELACVLIPVGSTLILLPNVTVAEILPWRRVKPLENGPDWCLGVIGWRGKTIPVVSYDLINGSDAISRRTGRCLTVMNRARTRDGKAFYAMAAQGLPRLLRIAPADVKTESSPLGLVDAMAVTVGTDKAIVPDLGLMEDKIKGLEIPKTT